MAKSFSAKQYFKKVHSSVLLADFYQTHNIQALFEITENTPRKNAIAIFQDFHNSLTPEQKIDTRSDLMVIESLSTPWGVMLCELLTKEKGAKNTETVVECKTDHDRALYYFLHKRDIFDEALYFHAFYVKPKYMLYEAKTIDIAKVTLLLGELSREFTRIANKEERITECVTEMKVLDGLVYVNATFEGTPSLTMKKDAVSGEMDKAKTVKSIEEVRIVYFAKEKEVLIAYSGSKYEKLIFLDTFLRVVCEDGYTGKEEVFDISPLKDETFDFTKTNKGVPLLMWKIKAVTLSFGENEKAKKKLRLTIPSGRQEYGLTPLFETLDELGITKQFNGYTIENVALSFSFSDKRNSEKSVNVGCTLSTVKSSLIPLFPYHRYARTLLKQAGLDKGFIEVEKKVKEEVAKKWEE